MDKLNRILQLFSVTLLHVVQFFGATHIPGIIILYQLFFYTPLWPFVLLYVSWTYLAEWKTPERGGRDYLRNFTRRLSIFKFMRDYYPITLVKTSDLDPQKNYIFGYHPHGVFTEGASIGLNTEACGFCEKFPGIIPHLSVTSGILNNLTGLVLWNSNFACMLENDNNGNHFGSTFWAAKCSTIFH